MQNIWDAGQVEYRTVGMQDTVVGMHERWDAGQVEYRKGEMQDR